MSTDRELLELAAKAAGFGSVVQFNGTWGVFDPKRGVVQPYREWSPLTDDGAALRLAVKLSLNVNCYTSKVCMASRCAVVEIYSERIAECVEEAANDKPEEAARRAIVRAAAEIGRSMP